MIYKIWHQTNYTYPDTVQLMPHILRLTPRTDSSQSLISSHILVEPSLDRIYDSLDLNNNWAKHCFFADPVSHLKITAQSIVETKESNPFEFYVEPDCAYLPRLEVQGVQNNLFTQPSIEKPKILDLISRELHRKFDGYTLAVLVELCRTLSNCIAYKERVEGPPRSAFDTWNLKVASCRDFAVLFRDCVQILGLPARFVSGYAEGPVIHSNSMHAWTEVFIPGAGWKGFDCTSGLMTDHRYVAVASAYEPQDVSPVVGFFKGNTASVKPEVRVTITAS